METGWVYKTVKPRASRTRINYIGLRELIKDDYGFVGDIAGSLML